MRNSILEEIHAARRKILADYDGDTAAYLRDAQARLEASGRTIAQFKQRTIRTHKELKPGINFRQSTDADERDQAADC